MKTEVGVMTPTYDGVIWIREAAMYVKKQPVRFPPKIKKPVEASPGIGYVISAATSSVVGNTGTLPAPNKTDDMQSIGQLLGRICRTKLHEVMSVAM
mmetsp:Transcript_84495/g.149522  ORF Transcript_84495/g.149522 Transcript_84495/m.149522 type:complete len:97 (-) Transcript_84495:1230-1520(-)